MRVRLPGHFWAGIALLAALALALQVLDLPALPVVMGAGAAGALIGRGVLG